MRSPSRCAMPMRIPAFAAEALALPGEAFLADQMAVADVDAIHAVRDSARAAIGQALAGRIARDLRAADRYRAVQHRRRRDRPACRCAMPASPISRRTAMPKGSRGRRRSSMPAQNMTDVLTALAVLSAIDCPERRAALDAFHASLAWRRSGAGQVVRHSGDVAACRTRRMRCVRWHGTPTSICAIRIACARWSPASLPATRCGSTIRPAAAIGSWPTPSSRSTRRTARSPRAWSRRSASGGASSRHDRR